MLEHGQRIVCLEGRAADRLLPALLPLLDGTRTVDEIVRVLGEPARQAIERALVELHEHGLLVEGPPVDSAEAWTVKGTAELLAALRPGGSPAEALKSARGCSIAVAGGGAVGVESARLLRLSGVDVERADGPAPGVDLTVCAPSRDELPALRGWNDRALAAGSPWLQLLGFDGRYAAIGPLYLPGDTCCYDCFCLRRAANADGAAEEIPLLDGVGAAYPSAPAVDAAAAALAAQIALGWLVHADHYAPSAFYALELVPTLSLTVHHVHRVPRCPTCAGLSAVSPPLPWHKEVVHAGTV